MSKLATAFPVDGIAYPERQVPRLNSLDHLAERIIAPAARRLAGRIPQPDSFLALVGQWERPFHTLSRQAVQDEAALLKTQLVRDGYQEKVVARTFALVREVAYRMLGQRHFDVQMLGGWALLKGLIAEMDTGEGKTLTATLAACTAALAGTPVHVVTVNDYLAARDAEAMGPVYRTLGLSVGVIVHGLTAEARRAAYGCDVTYCTNKELVFDYLKDRLVVGQQDGRVHLQLERLYHDHARIDRLLLRGLHYAIVDEADSVLIDEARTPLVIAGRGSDVLERRVYEQAIELAKTLAEGRDFALDRRHRAVRLTPTGEGLVHRTAGSLEGLWKGRQRRLALVSQALTALHLFIRDQHYLVHDNKVQIVDEYTGRVMPDRNWERGLHQMIETKEGCPLGDRHETLARISYQRFFRRYLRLAGMTGTAREVTKELWAVYGLGTVRIPTNRPTKRVGVREQVFETADDKWAAVVDEIQQAHRAGRPVLVGTRSVAASEHLSRLLCQKGLPHQVLNARQDREEATIVARAGEPGRITVATNMAGRGTDIKLAPVVVPLGGLHVIATERHDAGRIDRQLFGRCARQGDPGTYAVLLSLEDELVMTHGDSWTRWVARQARVLPGTWLQRLGKFVTRRAQRRAERLHSRVRQAVLKMDDQLDSALAFTGRSE